MKKLLVVMLMLVASVAGAQSDCNADYCGSVPIMGAFDDAAWNTDMFLKVEGNGLYYLRFRAVPPTPYTPHIFAQITVADEQVFGVYDLVKLLWGDVEYDGVVLLDWASYDAPLETEVLPLLRKNNTFAGVTSSYLIDAGCHTVPAPWSGGSTTVSLQVYNPNEVANQTIQVNGGEILVVPASPLDDLNFIVVEFDYAGAWVEFCIGVDQAGSGAGFNFEQPLWILPRFIHAGDRVTTRIW